MKISLIMLTIDRAEMTMRVTDENLRRIGVPYELIVIDNGSTDPALKEWIKERAHIYRFNAQNEGVARMQNWGMFQSGAYFISLLGNDIEMPHDWGKKMVHAHKRLAGLGSVGIDCLGFTNGKEITERAGIRFYHMDNAFGTVVFSRLLTRQLGFLCNRFHPYGLEDSDWHHRTRQAGYFHAMLADETSIHVGHDVKEQSVYRAMKWESLHKLGNADILGQQIAQSEKSGVHLPINNYLTPDEALRIMAVNPIRGAGIHP